MELVKEELENFVDHLWEQSIIPKLCEYIKIPNVAPSFDNNWQANGFIEEAVQLAVDWILQLGIEGMELSIERLENRTPLIFMDIAPTDTANKSTVLLYGHLDKQPEMTGWDEDKGPWKPVIQDDKLYGRGAADDGYALFSILTAVKALQSRNIPHSRCVVIIESCEEGGSNDLPYYIEKLESRIGKPDFIVCLDSGCGNYDQLWLTTSLRGSVIGTLSVELLKQGIHSGSGGGVVASSFRVLRNILERLEDSATGAIQIDELNLDIPEERLVQARQTAKIFGKKFFESYPLLPGVTTTTDDPYELILNRTWRPSLSFVGTDGFPPVETAGNVLRPKSMFKLSMRIPPLVDSQSIAEKVQNILEKDPPYGARVQYTPMGGTNGWNAPAMSNWFGEALNESSNRYFGKAPVFMGEGGSVPFMHLLASKFPKAEFMITGVLGPHSNAHGPNEFLHLPTVKKLTCCVTHVLAKQANS